MVLVPLLLLVSPGHAATRPSGARSATLSRPQALATRPASGGESSSASSMWPVLVVDYRSYVTTTTTTTTTSTTTTTTAPPVRAAPVTTTTVPATTTTTAPPPAHEATGQASWYNAPDGVCASPSLSYGTRVTVTDVQTGGTVTCTVEDRQSTSTGRILDLAESTFARLADPSQGVIEVRITW